MLASNTVGVVSGVRSHNGIVLYQVSLPGGQAPMVMEDGVRPAAITDPIERLRAGELQQPAVDQPEAGRDPADLCLPAR